MFNWEGRYRRWPFFWRFALLSSVLRAINARWDKAVLQAYLNGDASLSVVNYVICWQCAVAMFLLAPCVMKRMRDSGYRSFWWFLGWVSFAPTQLVIIDVSPTGSSILSCSYLVCVVSFIVVSVALLSRTKGED